MIKIPESKTNNEGLNLKKLEAYGEYLRKILNNFEYSSFALFKFINFDFIKGEIVGDNKMMQDYQNLNALNYKNISKEWTATGLPCEVVGVEVTESEAG